MWGSIFTGQQPNLMDVVSVFGTILGIFGVWGFVSSRKLLKELKRYKALFNAAKLEIEKERGRSQHASYCDGFVEGFRSASKEKLEKPNVLDPLSLEDCDVLKRSSILQLGPPRKTYEDGLIEGAESYARYLQNDV